MAAASGENRGDSEQLNDAAGLVDRDFDVSISLTVHPGQRVNGLGSGDTVEASGPGRTEAQTDE